MKVSFKKTVLALAAACLSIGYAANADDVNKESKPYKGQAQTIPGFIKPALYDEGGEGVAYHDTDPDNKAAGSFRKNEGVDTGGAEQTVGWVMSGEWIKYTVNVRKSGDYDIILHYGRANDYSGPATQIDLSVNDAKLATLNIDSKGTGKDWAVTGRQFAELPVRLEAGSNVLLVKFSGGSVNFGGLDFRDAIPVKGSLKLPAECVVFAPFTKASGIPSADLLRQVPKSLTLAGVTAEAKTASFNVANRTLDLASHIGEKGEKAIGKTAFVYIPFSVTEAGPLTFGFGADWWYEAYLDGTQISSTMEDGNGNWPATIHDHPVTVEAAAGNHLLVIRFVSGKGSSSLSVGGPGDLRNPYLTISTVAAPDAKQSIHVSAAGARPGPPSGRKWKMVWNDEFDGTQLNGEKWVVENGQGKLNWPEIATRYSPEMSGLDGEGNFVMSLKKDKDGTVLYGPLKIYSRMTKAYGYYEARVQFSTQPGWWTAFWLSGVPYGEGADTFVSPQEFDIYEDFYKPKKSNDIQMSYWATSGLGTGSENQDPSPKNPTLEVTKISRLLACRKVLLEQYGAWHTVALEWTPLEHVFYVDGQETQRQSYKDVPITTVPLHIIASWQSGTPKEGAKPFYGRLEEAQLPDQVKFDYVRVYDEDHGNKTAPEVTVEQLDTGKIMAGSPVRFRVRAKDNDGSVKKLMLFSKGYLRAELEVDRSECEHVFTLSNLFSDENTIKAMAQDNDGLVGISPSVTLTVLTGREYTGTAYKGELQSIPGRIIAGHYDEGGNGVAYAMVRTSNRDKRSVWRADEIGWSEEFVIPAGGESSEPVWITYQVNVTEAGEYDVELFMNRPETAVSQSAHKPVVEEFIQLDVDGSKMAEWTMSSKWSSGKNWRNPVLPIGKQRIKLSAGKHQLILRFDRMKTVYTFFGGLEFTKVK
jgi:beta-glucanase (GH16 family)